jgi:putative transposase
VPLFHHSDSGVQYASEEFQCKLNELELICSMSAKGCCYDNAVVESFFHSLKVELVYCQQFKTREEAKSEVFQFIEMFYNQVRLHSTLGYRSPNEYDMQYWMKNVA